MLLRKLFLVALRIQGSHIIDIPNHFRAHLIGEGLKKGAIFRVVKEAPLTSQSEFYTLTEKEAKSEAGKIFSLKKINHSTFELQPIDDRYQP